MFRGTGLYRFAFVQLGILTLRFVTAVHGGIGRYALIAC